MAAFSNQTLRQIEQVAQAYGIDAAVLKAVAEVESGGRAFAYVGGRKEPLIRFEGHYFDRLIDGAKRDQARAEGLASPSAGAVKNPRKQVDRWRLIERASKLDRAAALQSVSWGIGQVMGAHWKQLGYSSVEALAREARGGVDGQLRLMLRFINTNRLTPLLHARDWAGFARRYNGPGYAKNRYDLRLAAAYARHRAQQGPPKKPVPSVRRRGALRRGDRGSQVRDLQRMLTATGFPLRVDGAFGPRTEAALRAFQRLHGVAVDGVYGPHAAKALRAALPDWGSAPGFVFRVIGWFRRLRQGLSAD